VFFAGVSACLVDGLFRLFNQPLDVSSICWKRGHAGNHVSIRVLCAKLAMES
jgi:hypothetical protein